MTENISNIQRSNSNYYEIDIIELTKTLWDNRKTIVKTTLVFSAIGLFFAIFTPKEYTSTTTFVPQVSEGKSFGGNLGGLAAMAGINLGTMGGSKGISSKLYPQILSSVPFQLELLQTPLTIEGQSDKITYEYYYLNVVTPSLLDYLKKYTVGLPSLIITAFKDNPVNMPDTISDKSLLSISKEQDKLINELRSQIVLEVNEKDGYVTISVNMPEPVASAELAQRVEDLLQQYVIDFKIQKSIEQLEFIKDRYAVAEKEFKSVQTKLANDKDRNQNVTTARAKASTEMLQDEYNLTYGVYSELAKQLEAQYIQVTEDTPLFTVLKPVTIPINSSKPNRLSILILWMSVGILLGVAFVLVKFFFKNIESKWIDSLDNN